jgi:uncharacterized membrane protein
MNTTIRKFVGAMLSAGWILPLAFGVDCYLSYVEFDLPLLAQGKVPYNSFPMMQAAHVFFLISACWLSFVVFIWALRSLKQDH